MPKQPNRRSHPAGGKKHRGRYWVIGGVVATAALLLIASLMVRQTTSAASMERRLRMVLGPSGDSLYQVRVGSSHLSLLGGTYLATGIEILPDSLAFRQRREAGTPVRRRFALRAASLRVTGLDVWGLFRGRIQTASAVAESLLVEVYLDRTVPGRADTLRQLPHEFFRSVLTPVRIDTIRFDHSEFRYSERAIDGARPGTIRFANARVEVYNLTSDTLRPNTPVVIDVHTLLAGSAPADLVFAYDFRTPKLNLDYHGSVGDLDARRLNEMTVDLEGIRLTGGSLDSAWFKFRVKDGVANGEMQLLYRDLKAEFIDKKTGESGLSDWLKSFVANTFMLRGDNRREDDHPARTASIRGFVRTSDVPLTQYVWHTLREGLFLTITGEPPKVGAKAKAIRRGH